MKKVSFLISSVLITVSIFTSFKSSSNKSEAFSKEVTIGKQIWMTENLNVDYFRNGEPIPHAKTIDEWKKAGKKGKPAWCYYNNNPDMGNRYGKLYNWYAVNDPRGLTPIGWKIPTDQDWSILTDFLGGEHVAGLKMKYIYWAAFFDQNGNGTNKSGFSGLPGGSYSYKNGSFIDITKKGNWWSSTEYNSDEAIHFLLVNQHGGSYKPHSDKKDGFSVRCLRY